ncbi:alpha/beta hydrolase [Lactobacillus hamsteri]|uniref:Cell surface hydrolase n=1 Tax=Lactobacillus hamsteri DSM 5661 = JCM 6256 TaxID=1423754 RepID=A0A0R1YFG4_9LACO|nr:alpha/beta hydrolase [Lactobacillus hamsteri]KRM40725.1 hypothetical protein FC39_GL000209 [Lactobacillus hamsteri DSM 5661 = JCM 6256]
MRKRNYSIIAIAIAVVAIIAGIFIFKNYSKQNEVQEIASVKVESRTVPTFFFHGWGSSYHAEEDMVKAIKHAGVTKSVIRANVTRSGKVILHGRLNKNARNPIIEVNFDDNKLSGYQGDYVRAYENAGSRYVKNVIQKVTSKYHYNQINIVAHSMGNLEVAYYFKRYPELQKQIQVNHFISMAGHYDGIIGENDKPNQLKIDKKTGKPSFMRPEYRGLLPLRKTFPRNTRVLNIFGNREDGTNSDGPVSNASARSLRYLINGRAKSYRELMIRGKNAQHSKLHNNRQVNQAIVNFLWR